MGIARPHKQKNMNYKHRLPNIITINDYPRANINSSKKNIRILNDLQNNKMIRINVQLNVVLTNWKDFISKLVLNYKSHIKITEHVNSLDIIKNT